MLKAPLFILSLLAGLAAIACALLMPSHFRAIDKEVLVQSGKGSPALVDFGTELVPAHVSSARLILKAANQLNLTHTLRFSSAIRAAEETGSAYRNSPFHTAEMQALLGGPADYQYLSKTPFLKVMGNRITREKFQHEINQPDALHILQNLTLTNTVIFAPARSAAGLPFEVAVLTTAMLFQEHSLGNALITPIKEDILALCRSASRTNANTSLEEFYVDIFALAKRLTWEQMTDFVSRFKTLAALDSSVRWMQEHQSELPVLFSAVLISSDGNALSDYFAQYPQTALDDIKLALGSGSAALQRLLALQDPVFRSSARASAVKALGLDGFFNGLVKMVANSPNLAIFLKLDLLFIGAFMVVFAFRFTRSGGGDGYVWFSQFRFARQMVFSVLLLALLVVIGEPYLARGQSKEPAQPPATPHWNVPMLSEVLTSTPKSSGPMINASTFIALGIFFLLQASLYTIGLVKLAEIRRQPLSSAMKLKLLDNEENLFDAGLYAGLFGTASSLVLLTLRVITPSLMSAYASTLFGILFVAILKILHVRPYKRQLIIASQAEAPSA
jgi:hypothetical protein